MENKVKKCKHCGDDLSKVKHDPRSAQCARCRNYKHRYNIHGGDVDQMYESQNGQCYICDKDLERYTSTKSNALHVDHNHVTGEVRKLLCMKCNTMIGVIESNNVDINKITDYLK